ncbi:hypothetical protein CLFE_045700 (plasmid) [Clostridium felsineum DSM 794]|nr:hypothetical protein CLFE_045700 [Clostridium felsineum DSM 794]
MCQKKGGDFMSTMNVIVWMLPVFFILHDFEEIIFAEIWAKRYEKEIDATFTKKQPFGLRYIHNWRTATFSVGVEFIFLIYTIITLLSVIFNSYFLWYAFFMGLFLHFIFLHLVMCIRFKHYVPGIVTSAIFLIPNLWLLILAEKILKYSLFTNFCACILVIIVTVILMPALHKLMGIFSTWLYRYSKPKKLI